MGWNETLMKMDGWTYVMVLSQEKHNRWNAKWEIEQQIMNE